ncbi:MAG: PQQ-dependent sugar dehydrogenase [Methanomicrobiales archaeon]|nr:PQQ-dependent sugar dehydrogenase [Methanomicrobiales archaeon]
MQNPRALARGAIALEPLAEGFVSPVALADPGDGRLFIVDQTGKVFVIDPDRPQNRELFLDITDRVVRLNPRYDERGLLGLAFHPRFDRNGRFFVFYTAPLRAGAPPGWNCTSRLAEYRISDDPDRADPASERILMAIDKPQANHNGGHICFGPDGYLYIPLGDGGGANDRGAGHNPEIGNGQDTRTPLGKILRIDVDREEGGRAYGIPPDNPFVQGGGLPEIFAYGLRNPYHIAFDAGGDHALFAGDVGQNRWEEVDIIVRGGNYGWNLREGMHCFNPRDGARCYLGDAGEGLIDPILEYPNLSNGIGGIGSAVIGGYVYRGSAIPFLRGLYVFGDYTASRAGGAGRIFVGIPPAREGGRWTMDALEVGGRAALGEYVLAFGQDADRELYLLSSEGGSPSGGGGRVYRLVPPEGRAPPS